MRILGIDPGPDESAWCLAQTRGVPVVLGAAKMPNQSLLTSIIQTYGPPGGALSADRLVVERITPRSIPSGKRGPAVGTETLLTCEWAGRFMGGFEAAAGLGAGLVHAIARPDACRYFTGDPRATKPQVRAAILDYWPRTEPSALRGLTQKDHTWDAFATLLFWALSEGGFQVASDGSLRIAGAVTLPPVATLLAHRDA